EDERVRPLLTVLDQDTGIAQVVGSTGESVGVPQFARHYGIELCHRPWVTGRVEVVVYYRGDRDGRQRCCHRYCECIIGENYGTTVLVDWYGHTIRRYPGMSSSLKNEPALTVSVE